MKSIFYVVIIVLCLLSGCQSPSTPKEVSNAPLQSNDAKPKPLNPLIFDIESIKKLSIPSEQLSTIAEWLDDDTILYIKNEETGSKVLSHHLLSGESEVFFESMEPIFSVTANKDYSLFLIRTAPSHTEGRLSVLSDAGDVMAEWIFEGSTDLVTSWDPFSGNRLMVSSFKEDWSYDSYLLDVKTINMVKKEVEDPFVQWISEDKLGYINWNQEMPVLQAPLFGFDLTTNEKEELIEDVVMFQTYPNLLFTVGEINDGQSGLYTFRKLTDMTEIHSYDTPLLTMYSNYYIPYFSFVHGTDTFYTFEPLSGGNFDSYSGKFQFIKVDINTGAKEIIFKEMENKPIKFSPNGQLCLYGFQLEQLLIPSAGVTVDVVETF